MFTQNKTPRTRYNLAKQDQISDRSRRDSRVIQDELGIWAHQKFGLEKTISRKTIHRDLSDETCTTNDNYMPPPEEDLSLDDNLVRRINELVPELSLNDGTISATDELDLEANELDLIVTEPYDAAIVSIDGVKEEVGEEEEQVAEDNYKAKRKQVKFALETILLNNIPEIEGDEFFFWQASKKLKMIKEEQTFFNSLQNPKLRKKKFKN